LQKENPYSHRRGLEALDFFDDLLQNESDPSSKAPEFMVRVPNICPILNGWEFLKILDGKHAALIFLNLKSSDFISFS
jgi:hypothetical protein